MCEHEHITTVTRYYPGTYYDPPETELLLCKCEDCGEEVDWEDKSPDAVVTEVDWSDWY